MNLIEAIRCAEDGWVRSKLLTENEWVRLDPKSDSWRSEGGAYHSTLSFADLQTNDWEPKPKLMPLFETEAWVSSSGERIEICDQEGLVEQAHLLATGWRRMRLREVRE